MAKRRIHFLIPLGGLIALAALIGLLGTPKLIQYAFLPSNELSVYIDNMEPFRQALADAAEITALHGVKADVSLSVEGGANASGVTLYMVGERWNEAYPRPMAAGEPLSPAALKGRSRSIVLDEQLAFKLFGDGEPIGRAVTLSGQAFQVVGVAKHARRVGETGPYAAWIPLGSDETSGCDLMVVSAVSGIDGGLMTLFEGEARDFFGPGTLYGLMKERMRAGMILRFIALALALRLLALWIDVLKRVGGAWIAEYRARMKEAYFSKVLGFALSRCLAMLLAAAATLAACWALMNFFVEPVKVFVEWVPEVLVSFNSIRGRFWELTGAAAAPVTYVTAEMAELRFWAFLLRWGVIAALIGALLDRLVLIFPKENRAKQ